MQALPHTVVYIEGGYSDLNTPAYTAKVLNAVGVCKIRGFFTNDTHDNWTSLEVKWATAIAKRTHGAHFIVNTASNGRGALRNHNRRKNGNEDLCNPPGRALGPRDTTDTGFPLADAWMWTHPPGQQQRLRRRPRRRRLLADLRRGPRRPRQPEARPRLPQPARTSAIDGALGRIPRLRRGRGITIEGADDDRSTGPADRCSATGAGSGAPLCWARSLPRRC